MADRGMTNCFFEKTSKRCDCQDNEALSGTLRSAYVKNRNECRQIESDYRAAGGIVEKENPTPQTIHSYGQSITCDFIKSEYIVVSDACRCIETTILNGSFSMSERVWDVSSRSDCRELVRRYQEVGGFKGWKEQNPSGKPPHLE